MLYRNADRPMDYTPLQRSPAPFVIRHEGALTAAVFFLAIFVCGVLAMAHGL